MVISQRQFYSLIAFKKFVERIVVPKGLRNSIQVQVCFVFKTEIAITFKKPIAKENKKVFKLRKRENINLKPP